MAQLKGKILAGKVLVKPFEAEAKTASGIIIPDSAKEKPQKGLVEAVGSEVKEIKVGNTILFDKYSGSKVNIDNNEYLIIKEEDILGIVEG